VGEGIEPVDRRAIGDPVAARLAVVADRGAQLVVEQLGVAARALLGDVARVPAEQGEQRVAGDRGARRGQPRGVPRRAGARGGLLVAVAGGERGD